MAPRLTFLLAPGRLPWSVFQADRDSNNNSSVGNKQQPQRAAWQLALPADYSNKFTDYLFTTLRKSIDQAAKNVQAYFDYPNEMFQELHSHVANCRRNAQLYLANPICDEILRKIQQLMQNTADQQTSLLSSSSPLLANTARHSPIVLVGNEGSGKTTILAQVFSQSQDWFEPGGYRSNYSRSPLWSAAKSFERRQFFVRNLRAIFETLREASYSFKRFRLCSLEQPHFRI